MTTKARAPKGPAGLKDSLKTGESLGVSAIASPLGTGEGIWASVGDKEFRTLMEVSCAQERSRQRRYLHDTPAISRRALRDLKETTGSTDAEFAAVLGVPRTTLRRRLDTGLEALSERESALRVARVFCRAVEFFEGDLNSSRAWLRDSVPALENERPIDWMRTEAGAQVVIDLLDALSQGIYP